MIHSMMITGTGLPVHISVLDGEGLPIILHSAMVGTILICIQVRTMVGGVLIGGMVTMHLDMP